MCISVYFQANMSGRITFTVLPNSENSHRNSISNSVVSIYCTQKAAEILQCRYMVLRSILEFKVALSFPIN